MYVGTLYIQKYTHVSMPLSRSRGPVCLPIFVAIVVLQALSPTHVHMHVNNAALTLRHTHIHTGPHTFAGVFIVVAEKHGELLLLIFFVYRPFPNWFNSFVIVIEPRMFVHMYNTIFASVVTKNSFM